MTIHEKHLNISVSTGTFTLYFDWFFFCSCNIITYVIVGKQKCIQCDEFKNLRELRKTLESNQIPEGTSRLAGGPYRHQGLSSVVLIIGLEPITSDVSGRRSHQLSYMSGCGQGRTRTFNHSINSRGLYHWATSPNGGRGGTRTPKAFATDLQWACSRNIK